MYPGRWENKKEYCCVKNILNIFYCLFFVVPKYSEYYTIYQRYVFQKSIEAETVFTMTENKL